MATQTMTAEDLGLAQAIADTEEEIFTDANGTDPLDNDGDRSLEDMGDGLEGDQVEEPDEGEADEQEGEEAEIQAEASDDRQLERQEETPAARAEDGQRPGMVPSGRVREQTERARAAETQLEALRAEFEAFKAGIGQRPQQQAEPPKVEIPDQFAEPEKHTQWVIDQAVQAAQFRHVEASLSDAADTHGEKFKTAYGELQTLINSERAQSNGYSASAARIWNSPNPGKALMSWHAQQSTIKEVGNDPNAWLERKLEERLNDPDFLAAAIERARGSARQNGAREYTSNRRMPPSLNTQTGSTHLEADPDLMDPSERSVFDFATR